MLTPDHFIAKRIAPEARVRAERAVELLVHEANAALRLIVEHQTIWQGSAVHRDAAPGPWEGHRDVAFAVAPLAGGAAIAAVVPLVAITTTTFVGLFATTVVSWPIVVVGGVVAMAAMGKGVADTAGLGGKFKARLSAKARAHVAAALIKGPPKRPAILEQLVAALAKTAEEAKEL